MPLQGGAPGVGLLRRQVENAASADARRALVDATKKRAAASASSYGEFRALVDACHLRPLEKSAASDAASAGHVSGRRLLNACVKKQEPRWAASTLGLAQQTTQAEGGGCASQAPRSVWDLSAHWACLSSAAVDEQLRWLQSLPRPLLRRLFSVEVPARFLQEILKATTGRLHRRLQTEESSRAVLLERDAELLEFLHSLPSVRENPKLWVRSERASVCEALQAALEDLLKKATPPTESAFDKHDREESASQEGRRCSGAATARAASALCKWVKAIEH